ncbi:hypothetical protein [Vibrio owensii]|uniref:hypothetical protein n=1 Tax=Vibrio owensii TaxID=696485 RepID=UPI002F42AF6B
MSKQTKTVKKVTFYLVMIGVYMRMGDYFVSLVRNVEWYRYKPGGVRFAGFLIAMTREPYLYVSRG